MRGVHTTVVEKRMTAEPSPLGGGGGGFPLPQLTTWTVVSNLITSSHLSR